MTEQEYQEAVAWLFVQAPNYQIDGRKAYKPGLENITRLCAFFGNPQDKIKTIHIGGTNGKGSSSNMLASVLQEAGLRVGVYNSPHLVDFTERFKINGEKGDRQFVFDFIQKLKQLPRDIRPSFFEFTTVMAFEYFHQQKVDIAIIEVGLGGRLDSTNIITPVVSAITNVSLDHMNILGSTVEAIAAEKSGIVKPGVAVVSGDSNPAVKDIIRRRAESVRSRFIDATLIDEQYESDLKGNYQVHNIRVVLGVIGELRALGYSVSRDNIEEGLKHVYRNTAFIGRWFVYSEKPLTICDTAHNKAGLEAVFAQLNSMPQHKHVVLGFVKEKEINEVLSRLPDNAEFYFVKPAIRRGRSPLDYEEQLKTANILYKVFEDVQSGYISALQNVTGKDMIFIGGSNFVVGDFLEKNLEK